MLASSTYGVGRENATLSPQENDGIVIATSFIDTLPLNLAKAFVEKFKKYSGENEYVGEYGEYGYRGMMLWAEAVKKAGSPMPDDVIKALGGTKYNGAGGLYTIDGQTNHTVDGHPYRRRQHERELRCGEIVLAAAAVRHPGGVRSLKNPNDTKQYEPAL